jgi:hypothetical protein
MSTCHLFRSVLPQRTQQRSRFTGMVGAAANREERSGAFAGKRLRLCGTTAVFLCAIASAVCAQPITASPDGVAVCGDRVAALVMAASQRFTIPSSWICAVMRVESGGDARAVSSQGAMGLMQIMPETWITLRRRYNLGTDPYDPRDNITAGAGYLRELHDHYGDRGFLAAYNAGPGRYEEYLTSGHALPSETRSYVTAVAALVDGGSLESIGLATAVGTQGQSGTLFVAHTEVANAQVKQRPANGAARDWTALVPFSDGLFVQTSSRSGGP